MLGPCFTYHPRPLLWKRRGVVRLLSIFLTVVLMSAVATQVKAQGALTARYNMEAIDLDAGLPHNQVNQIFADSQGFIWISTYGGGAVRYDGYVMVKPVSSRPTDVASNSCRAFAEDPCQRLWVAYDEQTAVINLLSMDYVTPVYGDGDISRQLARPSVKVYADTQGGIWQVTRDSIYRYTFADNGSIDHISACHYRGNTPDITLIDVEQNGTVWINIDNGLYRLAEAGSQLVRKDLPPATRQLDGLYVTDLLKRDNTVWIATNLGLYAYNQYDSSLKAYRHTADPASLSHDFCTSLAIAPDGRLMIGTLRGINVIDEAQNDFMHWDTSSPEKPLTSDFVNCLLVRDGQAWIGTQTAGVVKLSPQPLILRQYQHDPHNPASLSANPVNAMYVTPDGILWAGTVEGGLNRKAPDGTFAHWTTHNSSLSHNAVSVLAPDNKGQLWIGTWGGGLNCVSLTAPHTVRHIDMPPEMRPLTEYLGSLAYDTINEILWIGSNDGIFYYDPADGTLHDPFDGNRDIRGCIGAYIDKDGQLWMGCLTGVCAIDLHSKKNADGRVKWRWLYHKLDHPHSNVVDKICCFCETKDGTLWLGSNGYGLYRRVVDPKTGEETFEGFDTDDGLVNNSVKGIVEDEQGRLWITTDNGLSVFNARTRTFNNYHESDGLLCQRYYWNSAVKGPDGTIYLGSLKGLTEIRGENDGVRFPVRLAFTRLMVDNQVITATDGSGIIDADISRARCIRLSESNKSMVIDFSTLTFNGEAQQHCSYRLKGFEREWIAIKPGEHSVRYTSLKPGTYTFEVRYDDADGEQQIISIQVVVTPYFWKTWWFILIVAVALAALIVWLYNRRMDALRRQEAEKLLVPIKKALDESDTPEQLRQHIQTMLDSQKYLNDSQHRTVEADNEEARKSQTFMERATDVMEQHYMDSEFGIDQLVDALGMSRSQVAKRIKDETGLSTSQFIRNYRLGVARKLLLENVANRNITEIAYRVGYNDPKYFTRCFTQLYGCSPSTYHLGAGGKEQGAGGNLGAGGKEQGAGE